MQISNDKQEFIKKLFRVSTRVTNFLKSMEV